VHERYVRRALSRWPKLVAAPENALSFDLHATAGLYVAPQGWQTDQLLESEHLLYHIAEGTFNARVHGEPFSVRSGTLLWVCPGTRISFQRTDERRLVFRRFRLRFALVDGRSVTLPSRYVMQPSLPEAETWFDHIVQDLGTPDRYSGELRRSLLICLLSLLVRHSKQASDGPLLSPAQRTLLEQRAADSPGDWPSIPELAELVGLTPDYFSRVFRRSYGMAPRDWLIRRRIALSRSYLRETTHSVGEIAEMLGYRDIFYFSKQFKQVVGHQPSRERR
jgi:AraC-like DNA-binding protein